MLGTAEILSPTSSKTLANGRPKMPLKVALSETDVRLMQLAGFW